MKKWWLWVGLCLLLVGCGPRASAEEKVLAALNGMAGYEAEVQLTRVSNKGTNTYEGKQFFRQADGAYRLELTAPENVAGNYTVFDGTRICQYNPKVDSKVVLDVPESQPRNELFLGQFMAHYNADPAAVAVREDWEGIDCLVLAADMGGDSPYLDTEKLWVETKEQKPVRLEIYDDTGTARYTVDYQSFTYDPEFAEGVFAIPD